MKSPFTGKEMFVQKETRTLSFRKEEFKVCFHVYKCEDTGEQFEDEQFSALNYNQLQNQYRAKLSIPFPDEIKAIREKYGLSAVKMSEVLGFGANSYRQYEAGEIPCQSNARLIQLSSSPHEFSKLVTLSNALEGNALEKLTHKIDNLLHEEKIAKNTVFVYQYLFGETQPSTFTGFVKPSVDKFAEMVLFFSQELKPLKTKLNKLLFYADFLHFQQTGFSISGVKYIAIQMGPVPNNFQSLYEYVANKDFVEIVNISFADEIVGEQFVPTSKKLFDTSLFSSSELEILNVVCQRFKDTSTRKIIDISHQETAWIDNQETKNSIDYIYAFDIK